MLSLTLHQQLLLEAQDRSDQGLRYQTTMCQQNNICTHHKHKAIQTHSTEKIITPVSFFCFTTTQYELNFFRIYDIL